MATEKKMVTLESKQLGKRQFSESHAASLLAIQKKLKTDDWQPVADEPQAPANKDNTVKNETTGAAGTSDSKSSQ